MTIVASRYDMRLEPDGTWTVFDIFTGLPVELNGVQIMCLAMKEAA